MFCVNGACATGDGPAKKSIFTGYKKPLDLTRFGGVDISSPRYDFYNGQLVRIVFELECEKKEADRCTNRLVRALDDLYGLDHVTMRELKPTPHRPGRVRQFLTPGDVMIEIRTGEDASSGRPLVKIYDKWMMDSIRMTVNPDFVPREFVRQSVR